MLVNPGNETGMKDRDGHETDGQQMMRCLEEGVEEGQKTRFLSFHPNLQELELQLLMNCLSLSEN